jgi:hypothetical protein
MFLTEPLGAISALFSHSYNSRFRISHLADIYSALRMPEKSAGESVKLFNRDIIEINILIQGR